MTNDELNRWYHEYLGKCVHNVKWEVPNISTIPPERDGRYRCQKQKCNAVVSEKWMRQGRYFVSDYLSHPAVILGIIKKLIKIHHVNIYSLIDDMGVEIVMDEYENQKPSYKRDRVRGESLEHAVMLALKAKVENEK